MAKQSYLEKFGIEEREKEVVINDYDDNDKYSATHEDAKSDPNRTDKPLGKGSGHGGHTHRLPDYSRGKYAKDYSQLDTFNGGGSYDIHGRNGVGGRHFLTTINNYNQENSYGPESVDTTENQQKGQFVVKPATGRKR